MPSDTRNGDDRNRPPNKDEDPPERLRDSTPKQPGHCERQKHIKHRRQAGYHPAVHRLIITEARGCAAAPSLPEPSVAVGKTGAPVVRVDLMALVRPQRACKAAGLRSARGRWNLRDGCGPAGGFRRGRGDAIRGHRGEEVPARRHLRDLRRRPSLCLGATRTRESSLTRSTQTTGDPKNGAPAGSVRGLR